VSSVICVFLQVSTWRCNGSKFRWMRSTPIESVSIRLNLLLCFAKTGVKAPETMSPNVRSLEVQEQIRISVRDTRGKSILLISRLVTSVSSPRRCWRPTIEGL
jgi:hypothetical protein